MSSAVTLARSAPAVWDVQRISTCEGARPRAAHTSDQEPVSTARSAPVAPRRRRERDPCQWRGGSPQSPVLQLMCESTSVMMR